MKQTDLKRESRIISAIVKTGDLLLPLIFALVIGSLFTLICGANPIELYGYIFSKAFLSLGGWFNTLGYATPIIITGIATALSMKAGVFNMGVEGQVYVGAFFSALAGYMIKGLPMVLHILVCLAIGAIGGTLFALIPGLLKGKLRVNEVVVTIMLNRIATVVTGFITQSYLGTGDAYAHTQNVLDTAKIPKIITKYRCTYAIFIALAIWLFAYYILKKTKLGYEINCIGKQWEFSDAVGMHVSNKIVLIFVIGGAFAGIAGATEILGANYNFTNSFSANPGIGWDGFYACILSSSNPVGVLIYAIVFGALRYGALVAQTGLGVPLDLINIIKSSLVMFMAIKIFYNNRDKIKAALRKNAAKADGNVVKEEEKAQ